MPARHHNKPAGQCRSERMGHPPPRADVYPFPRRQI
jgi:hypothetical protein